MSKKRILKEVFTLRSVVGLALLWALVLTLFMKPPASAEGQVSSPPQLSEAEQGSEAIHKNIPDLLIPAEGGSFKLSNLRLEKASASTKLKGEISNDTGQRWHEATFELKAFDDRGNQLKGVEEVTIFEVNNFDMKMTAPLDSGYGVWLEGIPFESVTRLEAVLIDGRLPATYKFEMSKPVASSDLTFEDEAVRISFDISADGIMFVLLKKSLIEIDWDKVRFIDSTGRRQPVERRDAQLGYSVLAPLTKIALPEKAVGGIIIPSEHLYYSNSVKSRTVTPLLPEGSRAVEYRGKSIGLVIPLNVNGVQKSYHFGFTVSDVESRRFYLQDRRYQFLDERRAPKLNNEVEE